MNTTYPNFFRFTSTIPSKAKHAPPARFTVSRSVHGLPWKRGLHTLRQTKHWKIDMECTRELLQLFVDDATLDDPRNVIGRALAELARTELSGGPHDRYSRFTSYMFPEADVTRTALLAQVLVFIVIFDGSS